MKKQTTTMLIASGLRGFAWAGLATAITAFFSWTFVSSTASPDWMGRADIHMSGRGA